MPKLKSNSSAAKRFKRTASGRYKHRRGFRSHMMTSKSQKRKRQLRANGLVDKSDTRSIRRLLNDPVS